MSKSLRKGVHSCQECRRRKVRCTFKREYGTTCTGCFSRRIPCVDQAQDPPSPAFVDKRQNVRERLARLEEQMKSVLNGQSPGEISGSSGSNSTDLSTSAPLGDENQTSISAPQSSMNPGGYHLNAPILSLFGTEALNSGEEIHNDPVGQPRLPVEDNENHLRSLKIRQTFLSMIPQPDDLRLILGGREAYWKTWHHIFPSDVDAKSQSTFLQYVIWGIGNSNLARVAISMLCIASSISQLDPSESALIRKLPLQPRELISRYLDMVEGFIISDTDLVSSYEGMEVMMLHAKLNVDIGQPRKAWVVYHRALALAQLMGWNHKRKLKPSETEQEVQRRQGIWSLFTQGDRLMSLLLGLPCAVSDNPYSLGDDALDWTSSSLTSDYRSRLSQIACQVINRNQADSELPFSVSTDIDNRLNRLAESVSWQWWNLTSNSAGGDIDAEDFNERLMTQFWHHQIRAFLHLPFALKSRNENQYGYSQLSCLEASRALSRAYHLLRSRDDAAFWLSKIIDHLGFIAAVLLLLRLRGYWRSQESSTDAQRDLGDWELVRTTTNHLRKVSSEFAGTSAAQAVQVIEHLLAANGDYGAAGGQKAIKRIAIPYFGTIAISALNLSSNTSDDNAGSQSHELTSEVHGQQIEPNNPTSFLHNEENQITMPQSLSDIQSLPDMSGPIDVDVDWFTILQQDLEQDWNCGLGS